ncbi:hypothetical protein [Glacieibacterium sp.]|uniref:hypothetical protein n=1 Tax=Glacieibacterium sp. TaxID=2860237 RepID=UPI003B00C675
MRRLSRRLPVIGALLIAGGAAAPPVATVTLAPGPMVEASNRGEVGIVIAVPGVSAPGGVPLFEIPEGATPIVTDAAGVVRGTTGAERNWTPQRAVSGDLTIRYRVTVTNTPTNGGTTPINPRLDGSGFSAIGMTLLAVPDLKTPYRIRIVWDLARMGPGATAVSSAGDGNAEMPAGPLSRLGSTAFMAGRLTRDPVPAQGKFSAAWSGDPGFDPHPPMQWAGALHSYMTKFFATPDDPAYRVFIRRNGLNNPGGGVAFPNSFFATYGPGVTGENMKQILGHEMTHTFTMNGLGNWYDEGDAVFYQVRLPWLAGMTSTETYLRDINLTAARYYTNAEIDAAEERIIPNFFTNTWLNTLGYDRGALYFAVLDGRIRRASSGRRSVDDLVRALVHLKRSGKDITESDWLDLVRREIGEDGVTVHRAMLSGGVVVPESGDYGPCFRRYSTKIRRYEMGFTAKAGPDGRKIVSLLIPGSEADRAGVRNGDIVVLPVITTEGVKRDPAATMTVAITRADRTFSLTFLPRGAAFDAYQWQRVPEVPDSACRRLGAAA